jgi:hypothetical protein
LDATPPGWAPREAAAAGIRERIQDFFSNLRFAVARWRWLADRSALQNSALGLLIPLVAILAFRLMKARRGERRSRREAEPARPIRWPGYDSELYLVEKALAARHLGRQEHETVAGWLRRLSAGHRWLAAGPDLEGISALHHRLRFDPNGLSAAERVELRQRSERWIADFKNDTNSTTAHN